MLQLQKNWLHGIKLGTAGIARPLGSNTTIESAIGQVAIRQVAIRQAVAR